METSGNNRYELLFMDDDGGASTPTIEVSPTKKPSTTASLPSKKTQVGAATNKKSNPNAEKENKAGTLNNIDAVKKTATTGVGQQPKQGAQATGGYNKRLGVEGGMRVGFKTDRQGGFGEGGEQRNFRRNYREGGGEGFNAATGVNGGGEFNSEQRQQRQFRERDGRAPPRSRYGENGFRGGKREFDRQSGSDKTGVKAVDKRDGAGAHNWGSVKQEIEDINKTNVSSDADPTLTDKEESANEQSADPTVPEEEETKEMTLDEWKAMRQQRSKPQFNIRKAGEGEDTSQWKKMVVLNKKKEAGDSEEELEYDPSMYPQRVGRLQRIIDIQFTFNDGRRGGGGFGRGRGRGTRPGGVERGGRFENSGRGRFENAGRGRFENEGRVSGGGGAPVDKLPLEKPRNFVNKPRGGEGGNAFKVDDERQFPTLS